MTDRLLPPDLVLCPDCGHPAHMHRELHPPASPRKVDDPTPCFAVTTCVVVETKNGNRRTEVSHCRCETVL